jgi:hypothetical protein
MRAIALLFVAGLTAGMPIVASGQTNTARDCAIAAGGRVEGNTLNCGYTPEKVGELLAAARADDQKQITTLNEALGKLSRESGLIEGAIRAVLNSLGKDQATIAPERLVGELFAAIGQISALRQGLMRQTNDVPDIAALKQRAITELDAGHFTEADRLLEDIHAREHAVAEARAKAMAAARADWLGSLQAEAVTSALLAAPLCDSAVGHSRSTVSKTGSARWRQRMPSPDGPMHRMRLQRCNSSVT